VDCSPIVGHGHVRFYHRVFAGETILMEVLVFFFLFLFFPNFFFFLFFMLQTLHQCGSGETTITCQDRLQPVAFVASLKQALPMRFSLTGFNRASLQQ